MRHAFTSLTKVICGGFIAAFVLTPPLKAQEPEFRFGLQASLAEPSGDITKWEKRAKTGYGVSLLTEMSLNDQMALRGRIEWTQFSDRDWGYGEKTGASSIAVWADYIYRANTHNNGIYVFAGPGFISGKLEDNTWEESVTVSGLGLSFGVGYNFTRNLGIEARCSKSLTAKFKDEGLSANYDFDSYQLSLCYRF